MKIKQTKKHLTDAWQVVLGTVPTIRKNQLARTWPFYYWLINVLHTYWGFKLKQLSGLFFLNLPTAWLRTAISLRPNNSPKIVCQKCRTHYVILYSIFLVAWEVSWLFGDTDAPEPTRGLEPVAVQRKRAWYVPTSGNELQRAKNCSMLNFDGFVDTDSTSSFSWCWI